MSADGSQWNEVEATTRRLLSLVRTRISAEGGSSVEHYLEHAEFEMALEGLLLEVMDAFPRGLSIDWSIYETLARQLRLDCDSALDGSFWAKFRTYLAMQGFERS